MNSDRKKFTSHGTFIHIDSEGGRLALDLENEEDARLLAGAPELFEALDLLLGYTMQLRNVPIEVVLLATNAVAKARGEL